jgi:membrane complex biogenesis BtpA family protein
MRCFHDVFARRPAVIGMIHLPPLPGYPDSPGIDRLVEHALCDLATLEDAGVDGVLVENEYDRPHRVTATAEVTSAMTRITCELVAARQHARIGCEILLNDPRASLASAAAAGADFIRTDYFVDRMTRAEYGEFEIDPAGLLRYRAAIGAGDVLILADIQVKYATMIEPRPLAESARLAASSGADAIVVTGTESGNAPLVGDLEAAAGELPVLIGSGLDARNAGRLLAACDGAIVGTAIMEEGRVSAAKIDSLMTAAGYR